MAISFDEVNDYYSIADDASLTLQDGDWCIGIWTRVEDNTGSFYQYLLNSNGSISAANAFSFLLQEESVATRFDRWQLILYNDNGDELLDNTTNGDGLTATAFGADGVDRLFIIQRDGNDLNVYACSAGGTPTLEMTSTPTNWTAINVDSWNIGRRKDGNADRYYGSIAGEFSKGDFALTTEEIAAIAGGIPPYKLGKSLDAYLPMESAEATSKDLIGANDATRQDAPTTVEHFPIGGGGEIIYVASAAGGATLVVQDSTHAHSVDNLVLTQGHQLVVQDLLHLHSVDALALAQANILTVAQLLHSHNVGVPDLSQANVLAVSELLHSHDIESPVLTQANTLSISDVLHAHGVDVPVLMQANILAVAELLHAHNTDAVGLTQANVLAVVDMLHGHGVDSPALTQANILAVHEVLHAHLLDHLSLSTGIVLDVTDALHGHSVDSLSLVQANILAIDSLLHGHAVDSPVLQISIVLTPADTLQAHSTQAVNLTQANVLEVVDAVHAHGVDALDLIQSAVLIVDDVLHGHLVDNILFYGGVINTPASRMYMVDDESRIVVVKYEHDIYIVLPEDRYKTIH